MAESNDVIRAKDFLLMGVDTWDLYRQAPGWVRDKFVAVDHFHQPDWKFDIAEIVVTEPFSISKHDKFLISVLANDGGKTPMRLDFGHGAFTRPNVCGSMVFGDMNYAGEFSGKGPYHLISSRFEGPFFRERIAKLWGITSDRYRSLYDHAFEDGELWFLLRHFLSVGRGAPSLLKPTQIADLFLALLLHRAVKRNEVLKVVTIELRKLAIQKVLCYITENYARPIKLEELADVSEMSQGHFSRQFRIEMAMSAMEYLKQFRLARVQTALQVSPELSISDIASQCGFPDAKSLHHHFKIEFGMTPGRSRG